MPPIPPSANNRTPIVTMETGPVICGRCRSELTPLIVEELKGIYQLRAGMVLIPRIKANCRNCGWTFYWNIKEEDIEKMTTTYEEVRKLLQNYKPE